MGLLLTDATAETTAVQAYTFGLHRRVGEGVLIRLILLLQRGRSCVINRFCLLPVYLSHQFLSIYLCPELICDLHIEQVFSRYL